MAGTKLNSLALASAGAVISALTMILLGLLGNLEIYMGAVNMMQEWHMFFSLDVLGVITGTIEAAVISFIPLYLFGWLYNRFS